MDSPIERWDRDTFWSMQFDLDGREIIPTRLYCSDTPKRDMVEVELTEYPDKVDWLCDELRAELDDSIDPDEIRRDDDRQRARDYRNRFWV